MRITLASTLATAVATASGQPSVEIQAVSWIVVDGESGEILGEHDADAERQPASLTKLMTAYVVLGALKRGSLQWDEEVTVNRSDIGGIENDEARMYLMPGQQVSVKELVRGLIVASANDAALVLAKRVGRTSAGFEQLMNQTAMSLGMTRTRFTTPSGITTLGNYSTARDLAILSIHLTEYFPEYYAYPPAQNFASGAFHKRNKNWLLSMDPSVDGLKTGHTREAGFCIAATAKRKQVDPPMTRRVFAGRYQM